MGGERVVYVFFHLLLVLKNYSRLKKGLKSFIKDGM